MASTETDDLLKTIEGGEELLAWFRGQVEFGDAEVVGLRLDRDDDCSLTLSIRRLGRSARVTFVLDHWIDVSLRGFSQQNVIGALSLRRASERRMEPWERGVGVEPGEFELELQPCFGAYGSVRANVRKIILEPIDE